MVCGRQKLQTVIKKCIVKNKSIEDKKALICKYSKLTEMIFSKLAKCVFWYTCNVHFLIFIFFPARIAVYAQIKNKLWQGIALLNLQIKSLIN